MFVFSRRRDTMHLPSYPQLCPGAGNVVTNGWCITEGMKKDDADTLTESNMPPPPPPPPPPPDSSIQSLVP